jgi:ankyrin repeat protein
MKPGSWLKRSLLVALVIFGSWLGLLLALLMHEPWVATDAYSTGAYRGIPKPVAGAFLKWAPYDPDFKVLGTQPLLHFACAIYGRAGTDRENSILAVRSLVSRGAEIDSRVTGMTSLHEAILYSIEDRNTELVRALLELGANPKLKISRPGTRMNDLTAIEYADLLRKRHPTEMRPVVDLLRKPAI